MKLHKIGTVIKIRTCCSSDARLDGPRLAVLAITSREKYCEANESEYDVWIQPPLEIPSTELLQQLGAWRPELKSR